MEIWAVSEVNRYLRRVIEDDLNLRSVWVQGEVSNFTVSMSGHAYFTLKDSLSQLKCVMFRQHLSRVRQRPENGELSVARGPIRVYEPQGIYQLYVEFVAPAGLGELQLRLEELRTRLEAEGLFEPTRKRPLPAWPERVGVVTSASGAVIHDIRTVMARRFPLAEIVVAPAPVQGDEAPARLCRAIEDLNHYGNVDVIVVARGGGSLEDLWAFNDETLARTIFASRVPVVSAIGHETDVTIADLVADHRAPTPSAAAEMVVPDEREVRARLAELTRSLCWQAQQRLEVRFAAVRQLADTLELRSPLGEIHDRHEEIARLLDRAAVSARHGLAVKTERLRARELQLQALDPKAILRRGYSVTWRADTRSVVTDPDQVQPGDRVVTRVADGAFESQVTDR
jgi:exodeoxyribonuclease VII large subunit